MRARRAALAAVSLPLVAVLVACDAGSDEPAAAPDATGPQGSVAGGEVSGPPDLEVAAVGADVDAVPHLALADLGQTRLAEGLVPPTNRWFSGLVFGDPMPVFPRPLSVGLEDGVVGIGLPVPDTAPSAITGPHIPAVSLDLGASDYEVTAYDDASVTATVVDGDGAPRATVVLAQGSPFLPVTAAADDVLVGVDLSGAEAVEAPDGWAALSSEAAGRTWYLVHPEGAEQDAVGVVLAAGETAVWFPEPDDADGAAVARLVEAATAPVVATTLSRGLDDRVARTTLSYATADGRPTVYATLPHHRAGEQPAREECDLGTYPSVYGALELCAGSVLTWWSPRRAPEGELDLSGLDGEHLDAVLAALPEDVAATPDPPADTYFGGKWLHRAATLVTLGEQLRADDVVAPLREEATRWLREWAETDGCEERDHFCFAYDPDARSVIGQVPSFGSEELNDHHFHYGYHLSAAGLLAAGDEDLVEDLAPVMDLLVADIAQPEASEQFPRLRNFDAYMGHSWASGTSPFADGNNQESSSEAVNAWNGVGLWAAASGRPDLVEHAAWLMSVEAAAALYWTALDLEDPVYDGYEHRVVALNWGAKRDYATWFSGEPSAMLGILLIPMGPYAGYLADAGPEQVAAASAEATADGNDVQFGDYILMFRSLAGPEEAREAWTEALELPGDVIDDGTTRSWMLAFIGSRT